MVSRALLSDNSEYFCGILVTSRFTTVQKKLHRVVFVFVCLSTFFVNNDVILPDIMESRNIVTAREMVSDGHWIVTTMNGEYRFEKPPLPTWFSAIAEIISPDNIALHRAFAGCAALLLIYFFYRFARKILLVEPMIATLLLCTCYNIILMGRTATWDIYCHAFMMGAICCLSEALMDERCSWRNFSLAGIFVGLSILSKGPVSLYALFLPYIICFSVAFRPKMKGKIGALVTMIVIAIIIGTSWYSYVYIAAYDAMQRIADKESGAWLNHNVRPWYYYWKFFLETGIWSVLLLTAIVVPLTSKICRANRRHMFALAWMLAVLLFLSFLPEKKSRYLLPILIPAAYTMAFLIERWKQQFADATALKSDRILFRTNTILIAVAVITLPVAAYFCVYREEMISLATFIIFTIVFWAIAAALLRFAIKYDTIRMLLTVTALFVFAECFVLPVLGPLFNNDAVNSISTTRDREDLQQLDFYYYNEEKNMRMEVVYAAYRKILPIDVTNIDSIKSKLPFALLTHGRVSDEIPQDILNEIDTIYIDEYDSNRWPVGHKRHLPSLVYNVTILNHKQTIDNQQDE